MADAYKTLIQAAISNVAATLGSAVGVGKSWIVKHISVVNTSGSAVTFQLFKNGTVAASAWTQSAISVPANGMAEWDGTEALASGEYFAGVASTNGDLKFTASGDEVS